jgi:hypothetical protein
LRKSFLGEKKTFYLECFSNNDNLKTNNQEGVKEDRKTEDLKIFFNKSQLSVNAPEKKESLKYLLRIKNRASIKKIRYPSQ